MVKLNKLWVSLAVFILLFANLALAVGEKIEFVENKVEIGVLYSNFADEDQDTIAVSGQFTLKNLDTVNNATDLKATFTFLPTLTGYSANDITDIDLLPSETKVVSFTINVPHGQDSGVRDIGSIVIKNTTETPLDTVVLSQNTKSMLELDNLDVDYISEDNNRESDSFDGESTEDLFRLEDNIKPGTEVTLTFDIENLFDNDYDGEGVLEDVTLRLEAKNDNDLFEDDFEEEYDVGDIDAQDSEELVVTFTISEDADADDYTFDITLEGDDGKNFNHQVEKQLEIKVRRERDDIRISKMELSPSTIQICNIENGFDLELEVKNYGTRDHRDVAVSVFNQELGISKNINNLELNAFSDNDNSWNEILEFDLSSNLKQKTYTIDIKAFVNNDDLIDIKKVNLIVSSCSTEEETPEEEEETPTTPPINEEIPEEEETPESGEIPITSGPIVSTIEGPYNNLLVPALFITVGLTIVAIIALFVILVKK